MIQPRLGLTKLSILDRAFQAGVEVYMDQVIIAVANQKGGVGKSTTAATISAELALRGFETLIIDCDPQSNATSHFLAPNQIGTSIAEVLVETDPRDKVPLESAIVTTEIEHLDIVPSKLRFAKFEKEPSIAITRLRSKLSTVRSVYDFVIIDTPPTLGQILTATLLASTHILVPVAASPLAQDGLDDLLSTFEEIQVSNGDLRVLGILCTMFDSRTSVAAETCRQLQDRYGDKVFDTIIHRTVKLEESPAFHKPIQLYAPNSRGSQLYNEFVEEMLGRVGVKKVKGKLKLATAES